MRTTDLDGHGAYVAEALTTGTRLDYETEDFVTIGGSPQERELARQLAGKLGTPLPQLPQQGTRCGGQAATHQSVRRLTPTETERLQAFPDGWTILPETLAANPDEPNPKPDSHRYAQMGNAVTVSVAGWLGNRIMEHGQ